MATAHPPAVGPVDDGSRSVAGPPRPPARGDRHADATRGGWPAAGPDGSQSGPRSPCRPPVVNSANRPPVLQATDQPRRDSRCAQPEVALPPRVHSASATRWPSPRAQAAGHRGARHAHHKCHPPPPLQQHTRPPAGDGSPRAKGKKKRKPKTNPRTHKNKLSGRSTIRPRWRRRRTAPAPTRRPFVGTTTRLDTPPPHRQTAHARRINRSLLYRPPSSALCPCPPPQ